LGLLPVFWSAVGQPVRGQHASSLATMSRRRAIKKQHGWIWDQLGVGSPPSYQYFRRVIYCISARCFLVASPSDRARNQKLHPGLQQVHVCAVLTAVSGHLLYVLSLFYGHGPEPPYGIDFYYFSPDKINIYPFYD